MESKRTSLGERFEKTAPALLVAVLLAGLIAVAFLATQRGPLAIPGGELRHFASEAEMLQYLGQAGSGSGNQMVGLEVGFGGGPAGNRLADVNMNTPPPAAPGAGYSTTNNQVAGVDEADIVKTDGQTIYIVSGGDVVLVNASTAAGAKVASRIEMDSWTTDLYINAGRLVVITHGYPYYVMGGIAREGVGQCTVDWLSTLPCEDSFTYYPYQTVVRVYDVSDIYAPSLVQNITLPGWFAGSRMIGDWVYVLTTEYVYYDQDDVILPAVGVDGVNVTLRPSDIGYFNDGSYGTTLLTVAAVATHNPAGFGHESFLISGAQTLYVSLTDLYVTSTAWRSWSSETETWIYRLGIEGGNVTYEAHGAVAGWILNQFSMDEHEGNLRVAVTNNAPERATSTAVYVLDGTLAVIGKIEGIAVGEQIFSARFLGDRGYIVTFRRIDPLFVLDLSDPTAPTILGELEIPGVSTYLHPYDETHLIGVGSASCDDPTNTWLNCVKLALFDVSDATAPTLVDEYIVATEGGSYSEAQWDHKAFFFSRDLNPDRLVIPVQTWSWAEVTTNDTERTEFYYSGWSGAYVFEVDVTGFALQGEITHTPENTTQQDPWYYGPQVRRSLYIGDDLYTVSDGLVKINALADLAEIKAVPL